MQINDYKAMFAFRLDIHHALFKGDIGIILYKFIIQYLINNEIDISYFKYLKTMQKKK